MGKVSLRLKAHLGTLTVRDVAPFVPFPLFGPTSPALGAQLREAAAEAFKPIRRRRRKGR